MLILATSLKDLRFAQLMEVYADSNRERAEQWPDLPPMFALEQAEQEHRQYLREVFFSTPGAVCAVWEEAGTYISALRLEPYRDGLLLAGLETASQYRRRGYAGLLIRQVQEVLARQGTVKLYSHVRKDNTASLKTHDSCGFRKISDRACYLDGSVDSRCSTYCFEG